MKRKPLVVILMIILLICMETGISEGTFSAQIATGEEWSWKNGASNVFEGTLELGEFAGREVSISMTSDLPYGETEKEESCPVFTIINGKRIQVLKQSSTARCTIDPENPAVSFSGRLILPEKQRADRITFQFTVTDANGQEIARASAAISGGNERKEGRFYISLNITTVTAGIAVAAVIIWLLILFRSLYSKKHIRREP